MVKERTEKQEPLFSLPQTYISHQFIEEALSMEPTEYQKKAERSKTALTKAEFNPQDPVSAYYIPAIAIGGEEVLPDYGVTEFDQGNAAFLCGLIGLVVGVVMFSFVFPLMRFISPEFYDSLLYLFTSVALSWYAGEKVGHTLCDHYYRTHH